MNKKPKITVVKILDVKIILLYLSFFTLISIVFAQNIYEFFTVELILLCLFAVSLFLLKALLIFIRDVFVR